MVSPGGIKNSAIRRESCRIDPIPMAAQAADQCTMLHLPDQNYLILSAGGQQSTISGPCQRIDGCRMAYQPPNWPQFVQRPDLNRMVRQRHGKPAAVG